VAHKAKKGKDEAGRPTVAVTVRLKAGEKCTVAVAE